MIFTKVVTLNSDGGAMVESIAAQHVVLVDSTDEGRKGYRPKDVWHYKSILDMPPKDRDNLNLLRWLPENDNIGIEDVGVRVGSKIFWLV